MSRKSTSSSAEIARAAAVHVEEERDAGALSPVICAVQDRLVREHEPVEPAQVAGPRRAEQRVRGAHERRAREAAQELGPIEERELPVLVPDPVQTVDHEDDAPVVRLDVADEEVDGVEHRLHRLVLVGQGLLRSPDGDDPADAVGDGLEHAGACAGSQRCLRREAGEGEEDCTRGDHSRGDLAEIQLGRSRGLRGFGGPFPCLSQPMDEVLRDRVRQNLVRGGEHGETGLVDDLPRFDVLERVAVPD